MKKVGLVLSGGAAYGLAHVGVIKVLVQNNIPIDYISGTSMGSLIGGLYCAGMTTDEMEKVLERSTRNMIVDLDIFGLTEGGLLYGKKVVNFLRKLVGNVNIEDLKIPYCAIAGDIKAGKKYVFKNGDLIDAIRASISIPGIFKPVIKDGMHLVDGGVCDNLPVGEVRNLSAEKVIAVDVCTFYSHEPKLKSVIDVLINSSNMLVSQMVQAQKDKGDVYIKIDQPNVNAEQLNYQNSLNAIKNGEEAALKALPKIRRMLKIKAPRKSRKFSQLANDMLIAHKEIEQNKNETQQNSRENKFENDIEHHDENI